MAKKCKQRVLEAAQPSLFDLMGSEQERIAAQTIEETRTEYEARQAAAPLFIPRTDADASEWGDFDSCLTEFRSNRCTLDGEPARIVGTPRTPPYATIEPVDLDAEPIRCCWDTVDQVMQDDGAFCRDDDDTDE